MRDHQHTALAYLNIVKYSWNNDMIIIVGDVERCVARKVDQGTKAGKQNYFKNLRAVLLLHHPKERSAMYFCLIFFRKRS